MLFNHRPLVQFISTVRKRAPQLPARCLLCGNNSGTSLCDSCSVDLPSLGTQCPRCAEPLISAAPLCARCQQNPRSAVLSATLAPLRYEWPTDVLVRRFKFESKLAAGQVLAAQLATAASFHMLDTGQRPDLLIPMPLHYRRRWHRGFNQSAELALQIGNSLNLPVSLDCARRIRATTTQSLLSAEKRASNLRGAFEVSPAVDGKHVAIIDDVMTTGTSVIELAHTAVNAGATRVEAWVATRAGSPAR